MTIRNRRLASLFPLAFLLAIQGCSSTSAAPQLPEAGRSQPKTSPEMSANKKTIERYLDGFNRIDHELILSCLTDDVEWEIPGMFHVRGKQAFDKEIENEAFVGSPKIATTRLVEEGDVVVAEGTVQAQKKAGGQLDLRFCDVFILRDGKIARLISYLMEVK